MLQYAVFKIKIVDSLKRSGCHPRVPLKSLHSREGIHYFQRNPLPYLKAWHKPPFVYGNYNFFTWNKRKLMRIVRGNISRAVSHWWSFRKRVAMACTYSDQAKPPCTDHLKDYFLPLQRQRWAHLWPHSPLLLFPKHALQFPHVPFKQP